MIYDIYENMIEYEVPLQPQQGGKPSAWSTSIEITYSNKGYLQAVAILTGKKQSAPQLNAKPNVVSKI